MIIVSHDRRGIVNFNNVESIGIGNPLENNEGLFNILCNTESCQYKIGRYKTEERAKQVLQEIVERYEYTQRLQESKGYSLTSGNNYVHTMPKE